MVETTKIIVIMYNCSNDLINTLSNFKTTRETFRNKTLLVTGPTLDSIQNRRCSIFIYAKGKRTLTTEIKPHFQD